MRLMTRQGVLVRTAGRFLRVHGDEWDIECGLRQLDGPA